MTDLDTNAAGKLRTWAAKSLDAMRAAITRADASLRPDYCDILARCVEILIAISSCQASCRFGKSSDDGQLTILAVLHLIDHNNGKATGGPTPHICLG